MADRIVVTGAGSHRLRWLAAVLILILSFAFVWGYGYLDLPDDLAFAAGLPLVAVLFAAGACLRRHHRRWRSPLRRLERTLAGVREGVLPVEELGGFDGPLALLARQVQELVHELKSHRAEMQAVQAEIRQLVAQRTDVLEQKLGSMRQQASRDPLTGLCNRRTFDEQVNTALSQATSSGGDVCLLMLDLDNFKLLNDTHGHAAGDEFLRDVGQIIRSGIRKQDTGFRCGGDEFMVLMPDTRRDEAEAMGQRLVGLIDGLGRTLKLALPVGASAGVANLRSLSDRSAAGLLREADRRQYQTKESRKLAIPTHREAARPRA